jgi:hypothetical protein
MSPRILYEKFTGLDVVLLGFVTITCTVPADCAGATAVNCVLLTNVTELAGNVPNLTVAPLWKPVPTMLLQGQALRM